MKIVEDKDVELVAGGSVINRATLSRFTYLKELNKKNKKKIKSRCLNEAYPILDNTISFLLLLLCNAHTTPT